jgi:hypothetical protein
VSLAAFVATLVLIRRDELDTVGEPVTASV